MIHIPGNYFSNKTPDFFYLEYHSDEALIGLEAKEKTPINAQFIVPMHFTEFKYFSERSLFIGYKSVVHRKNALDTWYVRVKKVYGIDVNDRRAGSDLYAEARSNYSELDSWAIEKLKMNGINYMVAFKSQSLPYEIIAENNSYILYKLN